MPVKLNCRKQTDIKLQAALDNCREILNPQADSPTVALLYSPDRCRFAMFVNGQLIDEEGQALPAPTIRNVFEARVFNPAAEFRWWHRANGEGDAVLLSERDIATFLEKEPVAELESEKLDELEPWEQTYLLWGEGTGIAPSEGWQRLTSARIGRLNVPVNKTVLPGKRVQLVACEYLREVDENGNVAVVEERLLKLEVA